MLENEAFVIIFIKMPSKEEFEAQLKKITFSCRADEKSYILIIIGRNNVKKFHSVLSENGMQFSVRSSNKCNPETQRLLWSSKQVEYFKTPFTVTDTTFKQCIVGPHYYKKSQSRKQHNHPGGKQSRFRLQPTRKIECCAELKITSIILFPEYKVVSDKDDRQTKFQLLNKLKTKMNTEENIVKEERFYVTVSKAAAHSHPVWTTFLNQPLECGVKERLMQIIADGIVHVCTIRVLLRTYVRENVSSNIPANSRAFFPSKRMIYNYILKYLYETKQSKIDQIALERKIDVWHNSVGGNFFFRPYREEQLESFLFCYQTEWQKNLLMRYQTAVLLDATYKTTKYSLPLFCIVVKTNVNYTVAGIFVVQHEDSRSIAEALKVFQEWNKDWKPSYFVVDYSEAEMNAITSCFPACMTYICDFHRLQAWQRWLRTKENVANGQDAEELLRLFKKIAASRNDVEFCKAEAELYASDSWKRNIRAQKYFCGTWLPVKNKWTQSFFDREYSFIINTNNGVESQNKTLKYAYLPNYVDKSLCGVLEIIITEFLCDAFRNYQTYNSCLDGKFKLYNIVIGT